MNWTTEQKIDSLLRLPWSIRSEVTAEGDRLLRVVEIPSAVGSGQSDDEAVADLWESLRASLAAYLHFEDKIPLPEGSPLPWAPGQSHDGPVVAIIVRQRRETLQNDPTEDDDATGGAAEWESRPAPVPLTPPRP